MRYNVPKFTCHCCDIVYGIEQDCNGVLVYLAQNVANQFNAEITGLNTVKCGYCGCESELDPSYLNQSKPLRFHKQRSDITSFNQDAVRSFFQTLFKSLDLKADLSLNDNKTYLSLTEVSGKKVAISVDEFITGLGLTDKKLVSDLQSLFDDEIFNKQKEILLRDTLSKLENGKGQMGG